LPRYLDTLLGLLLWLLRTLGRLLSLRLLGALLRLLMRGLFYALPLWLRLRGALRLCMLLRRCLGALLLLWGGLSLLLLSAVFPPLSIQRYRSEIYK